MRRGLLGLLALAGLAFYHVAAADEPSLEVAVKAAFLAKFGAYVDWPSSAFDGPSSPLTVCVSGNDPFGAALDKATAGQHVGDRAVAIKRVKLVTAHLGCQILFVGPNEAQTPKQALDAARGDSVLTVTDGAKGDAVGMIDFVLSDNRVRFNIDDQAASTSGLQVSSKLLSLALSVTPKR
ncbi:MAG TPA: YfiR family protein [Stellaceae bacterium]|nr:YfiR family protein [Stellaceae bacterium]